MGKFIFLKNKSGLDTLAKMAAEQYSYGCRFAKWRAVLKIGDGLPSQ